VRRAALAICAIAAAAAGVVAAAPSSRAPKADSGVIEPLPRPVRPAFVPGPAHRLGSTRYLLSYAPVLRPTVARARPSANAAPVTRVEMQTPEGTTNIVAVLGRRRDDAGRLWVKAGLATLPNGRAGWLPRAALGGYATVDTQLVVDLEHLTATLTKAGRVVLRARVAVGQPRWPTPRGRFYVRNRLTRFAGPTYGPVAFGTSARSEHLTDWPGGGFIGIHGTDQPQLIPGRVSHGCIRMRNTDILALARRMPIGTPLTIR
jgi:lipoprotein-anchoring transpeptidase ErfK/SrfK